MASIRDIVSVANSFKGGYKGGISPPLVTREFF